MPKGKGYSSMSGGSTKSTARNAPGDKMGGNTGKKVGDMGKRCAKGNKKTRGAADRYM